MLIMCKAKEVPINLLCFIYSRCKRFYWWLTVPQCRHSLALFQRSLLRERQRDIQSGDSESIAAQPKFTMNNYKLHNVLFESPASSYSCVRVWRSKRERNTACAFSRLAFVSLPSCTACQSFVENGEAKICQEASWGLGKVIKLKMRYRMAWRTNNETYVSFLRMFMLEKLH